MTWLNYHHLHYFWTVVEEGGIAAASRRLHVGRPSISAQLKTLETSLGSPLFVRRGRHLELTATGKLVHGYADEIFRMGEELASVVRGQSAGRRRALRVGVADVMMKLVAFRLLHSVLEDSDWATLRCSEGPPTQLFAALAVHELDLVLSDVPPTPQLDLRLRSRKILASRVGLFAAEALASSLEGEFPASLADVPFLMPSRASALRHGLDAWLERAGLRPVIAAEFDDSALLKVFAEAGHGVFPAPMSVARDLETRYGVQCLGEIPGVEDRCYVVTPARKHADPAVDAMIDRWEREMSGGREPTG